MYNVDITSELGVSIHFNDIFCVQRWILKTFNQGFAILFLNLRVKFKRVY